MLLLPSLGISVSVICEFSVTDNWLRDEYPIELKKITKEIDESERSELDVLFNEVNNEFEKDNVLQRFRKEKVKLIAHGQETIKALQREVKSIDKQLEKYSNLRVFENYTETEIPEY